MKGADGRKQSARHPAPSTPERGVTHPATCERQIACRGIDVVTTRPTAGIVKANRGS